MGFAPGPAVGWVRARCNAEVSSEAARAVADAALAGPRADEARARARLAELRPSPRQGPAPWRMHLTPESAEEEANAAAVAATMDALMTTPTLREGAVMPDACPAGPVGAIPVGGVIAAEGALHPGFRSADICCSLMTTAFDGVEPGALLDAIQAVTRFGPGGRRDGAFALPDALEERMRANLFLSGTKALAAARSQLGIQGGGNHFAYVGRSEGSGRVTLVTHHGSRGMGAALFRAGMEVDERYRRALSPDTPRGNALIPFPTEDGRLYREALGIARDWTRLNHELLHDAAARQLGRAPVDRWWNEHDFVFRDRGDLLACQGRHAGAGGPPARYRRVPDRPAEHGRADPAGRGRGRGTGLRAARGRAGTAAALRICADWPSGWARAFRRRRSSPPRPRGSMRGSPRGASTGRSCPRPTRTRTRSSARWRRRGWRASPTGSHRTGRSWRATGSATRPGGASARQRPAAAGPAQPPGGEEGGVAADGVPRLPQPSPGLRARARTSGSLARRSSSRSSISRSATRSRQSARRIAPRHALRAETGSHCIRARASHPRSAGGSASYSAIVRRRDVRSPRVIRDP